MRASASSLGALLLIGLSGCCTNDDAKSDSATIPTALAVDDSGEDNPSSLGEAATAEDEPEYDDPGELEDDNPAPVAIDLEDDAGIVTPPSRLGGGASLPLDGGARRPADAGAAKSPPEPPCKSQGSPCGTAGITCCPGLKCCALTASLRYCQLSCR